VVFGAASARRLPTIVSAAALTVLAMVAANAPMAALKVTEPMAALKVTGPSTWKPTRWLIDLVPHAVRLRHRGYPRSAALIRIDTRVPGGPSGRTRRTRIEQYCDCQRARRTAVAAVKHPFEYVGDPPAGGLASPAQRASAHYSTGIIHVRNLVGRGEHVQFADSQKGGMYRAGSVARFAASAVPERPVVWAVRGSPADWRHGSEQGHRWRAVGGRQMCDSSIATDHELGAGYQAGELGEAGGGRRPRLESGGCGHVPGEVSLRGRTGDQYPVAGRIQMTGDGGEPGGWPTAGGRLRAGMDDRDAGRDRDGRYSQPQVGFIGRHAMVP
jgi:hypothetical protein